MRLTAVSPLTNKPQARTVTPSVGPYFSGSPSLIEALETNDPEQLLKSLQNGADIHEKYQELCKGQTFLFNLFGSDKRFYNEMTALHKVVDYNDHANFQNTQKCLEILLKNGLDINARESDTQWTPLHRLMYKINPDPRIVQFLLDRGVDVNARDKHGKTALQEQLSPADFIWNKASLPIVKILVQNGADIQVKDDSGQTPLQFLARRQKPMLDIVQYLVNTGKTKEDKLALRQEFLSEHQKYLLEDKFSVSGPKPDETEREQYQAQVVATLKKLEQSLSIEDLSPNNKSKSHALPARSEESKKASHGILTKAWRDLCDFFRRFKKRILDFFLPSRNCQ